MWISEVSVWGQAGLVFISYFLFLYLRTINVLYITKKNIAGTLFTGGFVHIVHTFSIGLGAYGIINFTTHYPILIGSLTGSLLGSYLALKK